jgi:FKBP-type peptidyl-prolyl cis-trans isomerase
LIDAENKAKETALKQKKKHLRKYAPVVAAKKAYFTTVKATATTTFWTDLQNSPKGAGIKPVDGSTFYFHYAGYFEDGNLFDSSYEDVNKAYGTFDENRAAQNGYLFLFKQEKKTV